MNLHPSERHNTSSRFSGWLAALALTAALAAAGCDLQTFAHSSHTSTAADGTVIRTVTTMTVSKQADGRLRTRTSKTVVRRTPDGKELTESEETDETARPASSRVEIDVGNDGVKQKPLP